MGSQAGCAKRFAKMRSTHKESPEPPMENRTARLTLLIDPTKKQLFEEICASQDLTPSQVVRKLIRQYIQDNANGRELPEWLTTGAPTPHPGRK